MPDVNVVTHLHESLSPPINKILFVFSDYPMKSSVLSRLTILHCFERYILPILIQYRIVARQPTVLQSKVAERTKLSKICSKVGNICFKSRQNMPNWGYMCFNGRQYIFNPSISLNEKKGKISSDNPKIRKCEKNRCNMSDERAIPWKWPTTIHISCNFSGNSRCILNNDSLNIFIKQAFL